MKRFRFYLMTNAVSFTILVLMQAIVSIRNGYEIEPVSLLQLFALTTGACGINLVIEMLFKLQLRLLLIVQYITGIAVVIAGIALFNWNLPNIETLIVIFISFSIVFFGTLGVNSIREKKTVDDINRKIKEINKD